MCWGGVPNAATYEVWRNEVPYPQEPCLIVVAPAEPGEVCGVVAGTLCTAPPTTARLRVRACNEYGCGGYSDEVEFLAFLCIEGAAEVPCYPGAPLRLPEREWWRNV